MVRIVCGTNGQWYTICLVTALRRLPSLFARPVVTPNIVDKGLYLLYLVTLPVAMHQCITILWSASLSDDRGAFVWNMMTDQTSSRNLPRTIVLSSKTSPLTNIPRTNVPGTNLPLTNLPRTNLPANKPPPNKPPSNKHPSMDGWPHNALRHH